MSDQEWGVVQALVAHQLLGATDDPWLAVHERRSTADELAGHLLDVEPRERLERSKTLFGRSAAKADERHYEDVLRLYEQSDPSSETEEPNHTKQWIVRAGLALAAAVLLWWAIPQFLDEAAPLGTSYEAELRRDLVQIRSTAERGGLRVYRMDRSIEVWLRPTQAIDGPLEVAVHARRDGQTRLLTVEPTIQDSGAVHIVSGVESMGLTVGEWELLFIVGRRGTLPSHLEGLTDDPTTHPYELISVTVRIVDTNE